jgi:Protein of unknown function (DUF1631)
MVPELLQKLRTGLEGISFSPLETTQMFKQLEAVHLARLRSDSTPVDKPVEKQTDKVPVNEKSVNEVRSPTPTPTSEADLEAKALELAEKNAQRRAPQPAKPVESIDVPPTKVEEKTVDPVVVNEAQDMTRQEVPVTHEIEEDVSRISSQHLALVGNITQGTWFEMQGENGEKYRCRLAAIIRPAGKYIFVNRSGMKVAEESKETLALALQQKRLSILDDGMLFDRALEAVIGNLRDKRPG